MQLTVNDPTNQFCHLVFSASPEYVYQQAYNQSVWQMMTFRKNTLGASSKVIHNKADLAVQCNHQITTEPRF